MIKFRLAILLISSCFFIHILGCGDDDPTVATVGAPLVCFSMSSRLAEDALCPYDLEFVLDPSCSSDQETPTNDLEIRWDFENDGNWDTDFASLRPYSYYKPDPAITEWTARLQVRDLDGQVATGTNSIPIGPFPTEPDLIAGKICIETGIGGGFNPDCADTVGAGQEFSLLMYSSCFGDFSEAFFRNIVTIDGEVFAEESVSCSGGLFGCSGGGRSGYSIENPGTYVLVLVVDSDDIYTETDETNNTLSMTLTVTP